MSKTNSLRCPLCGKGRIADIPSGAEQSQYRLFALHRAEHPDLMPFRALSSMCMVTVFM